MVQDIFQFGFAGLAVLSALGAWLSRAHRGVLILAALTAVGCTSAARPVATPSEQPRPTLGASSPTVAAATPADTS